MVLVWMVSHDVKGLQRVKYGHNCIFHNAGVQVEEIALSQKNSEALQFQLCWLVYILCSIRLLGSLCVLLNEQYILTDLQNELI